MHLELFYQIPTVLPDLISQYFVGDINQTVVISLKYVWIDDSYNKTKRSISIVYWGDDPAESGLPNHLLSRRSDNMSVESVVKPY